MRARSPMIIFLMSASSKRRDLGMELLMSVAKAKLPVELALIARSSRSQVLVEQHSLSLDWQAHKGQLGQVEQDQCCSGYVRLPHQFDPAELSDYGLDLLAARGVIR